MNLQTSMKLTNANDEVQKLLGEAKEKVAKNISMQMLKEVLENTAREKEIMEEAKTKVAQLTASEQKQS